MTSGFIKLHRRMTKWEWYQDANTFRLFLHLIIKAQWEDSRFRGICVPRGSLVTGRQKLAKELNMSEKSVRTALEHLKSTNEVTIKTTNKFSVITVTNYGLYQDIDNETTNNVANETANKRPTNGQQVATLKEIKKERIEEKKNNKKEISLVLPPEFQTTVFGDAWAKWVSYRKNIRHALVQETAEGQIRKLMKLSGGNDSVAAEIIYQSMDNGWQGLFELKTDSGYKKQKITTKNLFAEIDEALNDNK